MTGAATRHADVLGRLALERRHYEVLGPGMQGQEPDKPLCTFNMPVTYQPTSAKKER